MSTLAVGEGSGGGNPQGWNVDGAQGPVADSFAQMFLVLGLSYSSKPAQCLGLAGESLSVWQQIDMC